MKKKQVAIDGLTIIGANPDAMLESPFDEYQIKKQKSVVWWQRTPVEILILLIMGAMDVALIFQVLDRILVEYILILNICVAGSALIAIIIPIIFVGPSLFQRFPEKLPGSKAILTAVTTLGLLFIVLLAIRYVAVDLDTESSPQAEVIAQRISTFLFFILQSASALISGVFGYYIARNHSIGELRAAELEVGRLETLISQAEACITELEHSDELIDRIIQGESRKKGAVILEVDAIKNHYLDHSRLRLAAALSQSPAQTSYLTTSHR